VWDREGRCCNSMSLLGVSAAIFGSIWLVLNVLSVRQAVL
jgi:hypothetical protein